VAPPYSMDLRQRLLADCDAGLKTKVVAEKYSVSKPWVRRLKQRRREDGRVAPLPQRRGPVPLCQTHGDALRQAVGADPDATLAELRQRLGLAVALSTVWKALDDLGLSFKKKSPTRPSRTGRT
jgi:transposase